MKIADVLRESTRSLFCRDISCAAVNLRTRLEKAFIAAGHGELAAFELASTWIERFIASIRDEISAWSKLGVPPPLCLDAARGVVFGFGHRFYDLAVPGGLDEEFWNLTLAVASLEPKGMLFCTAVLLYAMGCGTILIVDGPNDGGADVIGSVQDGNFAGLVVIGQSKRSTSSIAKSVVRSEVAKYRESQNTMQNYVRALNAVSGAGGLSLCYLIATNGVFEGAAIQYAPEVNVLLRNRFQIAWALRSRGITAAGFVNAATAVAPTLARDLSRNLVPRLDELLFAV